MLTREFESKSPFSHLLTALNNAVEAGNTQILSFSQGMACVRTPLLNGEKIFPEMKRLLLTARHEILLTGYKMHGGSDGETDFIESLEILSQKAVSEGFRVQVNIMMDRRTGIAGIVKDEGDNAFRHSVLLENIDIQYVEHPHNGFGSYHAKMLLIDGVAAMVSSAELASIDNYKDLQSRQVEIATFFHGELVESLRKEFITAWNATRCIGITGRKTLMHDMPIPDVEAPDITTGILAPALFFVKKEKGNIADRTYLSPFALAIMAAINQTEHSIDILTPNFNEETLIKALADAHAKNIKIRLVLSKHMNEKGENLPCMGGDNQKGIQKLFEEIARRGQDPFTNIEVRWATDVTSAHVIPFPHPNNIHARMVCIDNRFIFVGSSVWDKQSTFHSREADVVFCSEEIAEMYMREIYQPIFSKSCNVFFDPLNKIKVTVPLYIESKAALLYELNEHIKFSTAMIQGEWSVFKDHLPGRKHLLLAEMRLTLMDALKKDVLNDRDSLSLTQIVEKCIQENIRLTMQILFDDDKLNNIEMTTYRDDTTEENDYSDIPLGGLHQLLIKFKTEYRTIPSLSPA